MSNISQLVNFIDRRRTYDEVEDKADKIDPLWRESTWTRGLRSYKSIKAVKPNGVIIAYEPLNNPVEPNLNEVIRKIIKETPLSFDNREKLAELGKALTGDNWFKKSVIEKYKRG